MKKWCMFHGFLALFALVLGATGELTVSASTVKNTTASNSRQKAELSLAQSQSNVQLSQALVGQCRAVKQRIFVYPERSTSSISIRTLAPNEQVTLADNGVNGWIAISSPVVGYVRANELQPCPGGTRPPAAATQPPAQTGSQGGPNVCRQVVAPEQGLAVRNTPAIDAPRISGVYVGNTVKLASPRQSEKDSQGRTWVRISEPTTGWISSGFPDGNLGSEFSCP